MGVALWETTLFISASFSHTLLFASGERRRQGREKIPHFLLFEAGFPPGMI